MDSLRIDSPSREKNLEDMCRIFKGKTRDEWSKLFQEAKAFQIKELAERRTLKIR